MAVKIKRARVRQPDTFFPGVGDVSAYLDAEKDGIEMLWTGEELVLIKGDQSAIIPAANVVACYTSKADVFKTEPRDGANAPKPPQERHGKHRGKR